MKTLLRIVFALVLPAGAAVLFVAVSLTRPYKGFESPVYAVLEKGMSTPEFATRLAQSGVIRYRWQFLLVRMLRPRTVLLAGEYQFSKPESVLQIFDRLAKGDVYFYQLTVPEGSNIFDIAALLNQAGLTRASDFLSVAADGRLIRDLDPQAPSLEGYLFPSTYRVNHLTTAPEICREMTAQFRKHWKQLTGGKARAVHEVVTLASMVEKEAATRSDRPLIASVFFNRLQKKMRLECDPTTIYAAQLEQRYRGTIYRSDLTSQNSYNTYQHDGLPPGPIANPGVDSLNAVLHPAESDYLYFVVKPGSSGAHQFSRTLTAHEEAVRKYRRDQAKPLQAR
ncbi:MAG TPA: endolytic transglycosylase MltG [Bryobacteraceae bacterium]|nr:endolytic transglycosylase MltG [Bryobacteraceae bacterium]